MSKLLICTNHMASIGGSEVVALEVAEFFIKNNYHVDIVANYIGNPTIQLVKNSGGNLFTTDDLPDPFNYDIVWAQHQVLPILVNQYIDNFNNNTYFVFAHLSPYEYLETLGLYTERLLAHKIFSNSMETFSKLCNLGLSIDISDILFNAAPLEFFNKKKHNKEFLQKILLISNHPPEEILEALEILKLEYKLNIINIGVRGSIERITPKFIADADAVITIGKSVQYAIVGDTPVYCYDHFGGVGWLTIDNYKKAEEYNYSGRCCLRKISSRQIVDEIIFGFKKAEEDIHKIKHETSIKYCLDNYLSNIIKASEENTILRHLHLEDKQKIKSESEIVKSIKQYYNAYNKLVIDHNLLLTKYHKLTTSNDELLKKYNTLSLDKEYLLENNNLLLTDYTKLKKKFLKYKNTLLKRFARKIKRLYNKKE